jgi:ABC-2 type transport system ATP-binding protein
VKDVRHCYNCGAQNQPYAAFCVGCGRSFVAPGAPVRALSAAGDAPATAAEDTAKDSPPQGHKFVDALPTKPLRAAQITEETLRPVSEPERETSKRSEKPVTPAKKKAAGSYILKAEHLTKKFEDVTVVDDLNLEIKRGEVFGFLGPNGAGKTTSIKMMTGLLQPTSGRVLFNGAELVSMQKREIGICPQELVLWEALTCRENLTFMGKMYGVEKRELENRVNELLDYLSLTDKADQAASKLSGGMKRRLNIALSVVHHPEIVFLDEPSAGLDPQTRQLLWDFIRALRDKEGKTVILTTHVMEEADVLSDRVAIIDNGKLLLLDAPDALKKTMGKGDVVELQLGDIAMNNAIVQRVRTLDGIEEAYELKDRVAVRALNAPSKLPELIGVIEGVGGSVCDVTIRGNTLEDVFIYLTGRALRE